MNAVQTEILNVFLEIKKIIERHNLRYFAIGGTCLGAVRHKGFIPWDDDMDIAMPDKDYEEFMRIAPYELPPHMELRTPENTEGYICCFSKVHNKNTTCIEKYAIKYPDLYMGVYVDIMPLCGIPAKRETYIRKDRMLLFMNRFSRCDLAFSGLKKLINIFFYGLSNIVDNDYFYRRWHKFVFQYKFDVEEYTGYVWSEKILLLKDRRNFPSKWFDGYEEIPFEDTTVRCPIEWKEYLTVLFGDYMRLPAEEEQVSLHGISILDIERPYSYYKDLAERGEL